MTLLPFMKEKATTCGEILENLCIWIQCYALIDLLRLVFTSDGSRREPYALVKTARHKQKQKKKETFPFSSASASASVAIENKPLISANELKKYAQQCRIGL